MSSHLHIQNIKVGNKHATHVPVNTSYELKVEEYRLAVLTNPFAFHWRNVYVQNFKMDDLRYRLNTINVSQLHMKNIAWHTLICLPIETPLNRLQTSCSTSAVHRLGRCHLFVHTSLYLFVGRQTAAGATLCYSKYLNTAKQLKSEKVTLSTNF